MTESAIQSEKSVSQLRCIGCGKTALPDRFRCESCRDLLEIIYPGWQERGPGGLDAAALKQLWLDRRSSPSPARPSGGLRIPEIPTRLFPPQGSSLCQGNT